MGAAMADRRLQSILSHFSPPVITTTTTSSGDRFEFECRGPHSKREAKLMETVMFSQLQHHRLGGDCSASADISAVPCSSSSGGEEPKSLEVDTREETSSDGDDEPAERVRSGITSASAVSTSNPKPRGATHFSAATTCEFCDIIQGSAPCFKIYEDELCLCILDNNPLSFGHSLILPKAHFPCLEATPPQVAAAMCAAVPLISSALLAATRCDSFNMLVNSGVAAGQVIMHTHFHIIPRCKGDGLWKSESENRRPMCELHEAKSLAHMVRSKLQSSRAAPVLTESRQV